jgi:hypothetical protein
MNRSMAWLWVILVILKSLRRWFSTRQFTRPSDISDKWMTLSSLASWPLDALLLVHLNDVHYKFQFTMKKERNSHIPFLNNTIYKSDSSLGN